MSVNCANKILYENQILYVLNDGSGVLETTKPNGESKVQEISEKALNNFIKVFTRPRSAIFKDQLVRQVVSDNYNGDSAAPITEENNNYDLETRLLEARNNAERTITVKKLKSQYETPLTVLLQLLVASPALVAHYI